MKGCSDPLCGCTIDPLGPIFRVSGNAFCDAGCYHSWDMANTALVGAADPFRNSATAALYRARTTRFDQEQAALSRGW
jgi:hypothetical protein